MNKDETITIREIKEITAQEPAQVLSVYEDEAEKFKNKIAKLNQVADAIKQELIPIIDYMVIPGTNKPSLLKAGADKIALLFGLRADYIEEREVDPERNWIRYKYKCILFLSHNNQKIAEGDGVCSSGEPKWMKDRNRTKDWSEAENTIMKIAKKRAKIDAIIQIANLSKIFTQDMDDIQENNQSAAGYLASQIINKKEALGVFQLLYNTLIPNYKILSAQEKEPAKNQIKNKLPQLLNDLGIEPTKTIFDINQDEKNKIIKFLNDYAKKQLSGE